MVDALSQLVFCWRQIGYGMRLNNTLYTHVCWSDKWWLFVHKRAHLFQMIQSLAFVLYARRLKWKPDSPSFTGSSSGVDRQGVLAVEHVDQRLVLGVMLYARASTETMLERRISKAARGVFALNDSL